MSGWWQQKGSKTSTTRANRLCFKFFRSTPLRKHPFFRGTTSTETTSRFKKWQFSGFRRRIGGVDIDPVYILGYVTRCAVVIVACLRRLCNICHMCCDPASHHTRKIKYMSHAALWLCTLSKMNGPNSNQTDTNARSNPRIRMSGGLSKA